MAGETDRLVNFCREANPLYDPAEYDVVVASGRAGDQRAARADAAGDGLQGAQLARLATADPHRRGPCQGAGRRHRIRSAARLDGRRARSRSFPASRACRTMAASRRSGRGGSDTSAVAVAAAIKADRCDIYTDVDGVYTTDPRIVAKARKLKYVTYEEMLELASVGAKVLQTRSVSLAMKEGVRVQVLSSFIDDDAPPADDLPGTMIVSDEEMEGFGEAWNASSSPASPHDKNEAQGHPHPRARQARRGGAHLRARSADAIDQCRHDHPERRPRQGRDRRDLHRAAGRPRPRAGAARGQARTRSASTASSPTARSPRSASSASA